MTTIIFSLLFSALHLMVSWWYGDFDGSVLRGTPVARGAWLTQSTGWAGLGVVHLLEGDLISSLIAFASLWAGWWAFRIGRDGLRIVTSFRGLELRPYGRPR